MKSNNTRQRFVAIALSVFMIAGMMPVTASAQELESAEDLVWSADHTEALLSESDLLGNPAAKFVLKGLAQGALSSIGSRAADEAMAELFGQPPSEISKLINAFQEMADDVKRIQAEIDNLSAKIDQANLKSDLREYASGINKYAAVYEHLSRSLSTYGSDNELSKLFLAQLYAGADENFRVAGQSIIAATLALGNDVTKTFPGNNYNIFGAFDLLDKFRNRWEHQGYAQRQAFRDEAIYTYSLFCTMAQLACQTAIENNPGDSLAERLERSNAEMWLLLLKENAAKVYAMDQRCAVKEHPELRIYRDIRQGKDLYVFKTQVEIGKLPWQWTKPYTPKEYLYPMARTQNFNREDFANSYNLYSQQPSLTMYQKMYDDYGGKAALTSIFFDKDKGGFTLPSNADEVSSPYFATHTYTIRSKWEPMLVGIYSQWITNVVDNMAADEERSLLRLFTNMNGDVEVLNRHGNATVFSPIYYYGAVEQGKLMLPEEKPASEPADKISGMAPYYKLPHDDTVTLSVEEKEGYTHQWYVNVGNGYQEIAGSTGSIYTLPTLMGNMNGYQYICAFVKDADTDDLGRVGDGWESEILPSDETTGGDTPEEEDTGISAESVEDSPAFTEDMTDGDLTTSSDTAVRDSGESEILPSDETSDGDMLAGEDTNIPMESVNDSLALTKGAHQEPEEPTASLDEQNTKVNAMAIQSGDISVFSEETEEIPPEVWNDSNIYTAPVTLTLHGDGVPIPETEHEISSAEDLETALERVSDGEWDGHILRLTADIYYSHAITLLGRSLTFELNGFTLTVAPSRSTPENVDPMSSAPSIAAVYVGSNSVLVTQSNEGGAFHVSAGVGIAYGVYAASESYAEVSSVSIEGGGTAVYSENGRSVIIDGDLQANGPEAIGASCVDGGQIEVGGNVRVAGASSYGAMLHSSNGKTSYITIRGNLSVLGANSRGGYLNSTDASLIIKGNVSANNGFAGISVGQGHVVVDGDVSAYGSAISAWDGANVRVKGNVVSTDKDAVALSAVGAAVTIQKNISALGSQGVGIVATAWNIADPGLVAQVTVDGMLSAATPLRIEGSPIAESELTEPSTKPGYHTFTDGKSTVWVKPSSFVIPVFYALTVNSNGGNGATGAGSYTKDATVYIYAGTRIGYSFTRWTSSDVTITDAGNSNASFIMPDKAVTVTANWHYNGSSDGGGSTSGGSTVTSEPAKPNENNPNTPTEGTIKPPATVDKDGMVRISVTDKDIQNAIDKAMAQAKNDGTTENGISISIDLTGLKTEFSILPLTLSKSAYQKLVSAGVKTMSIHTPQISLSLDLETLKTIVDSAGGDVTINAVEVDKTKLSAEAQKELGNRLAYDLTIKSGGKLISSFGKGNISISLPYTQESGESAGSLTLAYVDRAGKVQTITQSSYDVNSKSIIGRTGHFTVFGIVSKPASAFTDIKGHWAEQDILFVATRGLLTGTSSTTFAPGSSMTRGMFVTALGRLASIDITKYKNTKFTDGKGGAAYAPYVAWAAEKNITSGTTATTFSPDKTITRQELAVLMQNYAKAMGYTMPKTREAVTFADSASIASWAKESVKAMQMAGIINGKDGNKFDPNSTATRAEVSAALRRFVELVVDPVTAQGWDKNDSGTSMLYENGKVVKSASHTVQKGDSFWVIDKKVGCTMAELEQLNGKSRYDTIYSRQGLKVPQV